MDHDLYTLCLGGTGMGKARMLQHLTDQLLAQRPECPFVILPDEEDQEAE